MPEVQGIDVSHYQQTINWQKVANKGIRFAIMKCQYEALPHRIDETFEYNYSEAGKVGIARGVYIFIGRDSMKDLERDANSLLNHLKNRKLEYGIWIDLESEHVRAKGKLYIENLVKVYAGIFRNSGYYVGIYCNRNWYLNCMTDFLKHNFDFWIARYPRNDYGIYNAHSSLRPSDKMAVAWQYSSKGSISGIKGNVDLDVDYDGIINLTNPDRKTNEQIAEEVLLGLWGTKFTKPTRKERLEAAGYNYQAIQAIVNQKKR